MAQFFVQCMLAISPADQFIEITVDGNYLVVGSAASPDIPGFHSGGDYWIAELDTSFQIVWEKCFGGSENDFGSTIDLTPDGFLVAGNAVSSDGDVTGNHGVEDYWILRFGNSISTKSIDVQSALTTITPNPTDGKLYLSMNKGKKHLAISDVNGRVLMDKFVFDREELLDLSDYNSGVYFLRVADNESVSTKSFVIQK